MNRGELEDLARMNRWPVWFTRFFDVGASCVLIAGACLMLIGFGAVLVAVFSPGAREAMTKWQGNRGPGRL